MGAHDNVAGTSLRAAATNAADCDTTAGYKRVTEHALWYSNEDPRGQWWTFGMRKRRARCLWR